MKKLLFAVLMLASVSAYAGMWILQNSYYSAGTGWLCTYQLSGANYTTTIISQSMCSPVINQ